MGEELSPVSVSAITQDFSDGSGGGVQFGQGKGALVSTWNSPSGDIQTLDLTPSEYDAWRQLNTQFTKFPDQYPYAAINTDGNSGTGVASQRLPNGPGKIANTIGIVKAQPPVSAVDPAKANPAPKPETALPKE